MSCHRATSRTVCRCPRCRPGSPTPYRKPSPPSIRPAPGIAPSAFFSNPVVASVVVAVNVWTSSNPVPFELMRKIVPRPLTPPADVVP